MRKRNQGWSRWVGLSSVAISLLIPMASFASPVELRWKPYFSRRTTQPPQDHSGVRFPSYEKLMTLSAQDRALILDSLRTYLIETDQEVKGSSRQSALLDLLFAQAFANPEENDAGQKFCINVGVVQPLDKCDKDKGEQMHDFDTTELLKPIGEGAVQCGGSAKPCSPVFGFDSGGKVFCTDSNRTRVCSAISRKAKGSISFESVMQACSGKEKLEKPPVDCAKLKEFYESQTALVAEHCADAPTRMACGVLRKQHEKVAKKLGEQTKDTGESDDALLRRAAEMAGGLQGAQAALTPAKVDCDKQPQQSQQPRQQGSGACKVVDQTKVAKVSLPTLFEQFDPSKEGKTCMEVLLPSQMSVKLTEEPGKEPEATFVRAQNGSSPRKEIKMDAEAFGILLDVAKALEKQKLVSDDKLLASYLPADLLADAGEFQLTNSKTQLVRKLKSKRGWKTLGGGQIRYGFEEDKSGKLAGVLYLGLTLEKGPEFVQSVDIPKEPKQ